MGTQELWTYCDDTGARQLFNFTPAVIAQNGDIIFNSTIDAEADAVSGERESSEVVVTRLDADGNLVFRTVIDALLATGEPAFVSAGSIVEGPLGSIFVNGQSDGELTAAPVLGDEDAYLLRLDEDGIIQ